MRSVGHRKEQPVNLTLRIPPDLIKRVKRLAEKRGRSMNYMLVKIIREEILLKEFEAARGE